MYLNISFANYNSQMIYFLKECIMTLGKEELQTSPEPSSKEKPTIDLAKIIIACHDK